LRVERRLLAFFVFLALVPVAGYYIVSSKVVDAKDAAVGGALCYTGNSTLVLNVSLTVDNPSLIPYRVKVEPVRASLEGLNASASGVRVLDGYADGRSATRVHMVVRLDYSGDCRGVGYKWISGNMTLRIVLEPAVPPVDVFSRKVVMYVPVGTYARIASG